jgi:hypothetical protein
VAHHVASGCVDQDAVAVVLDDDVQAGAHERAGRALVERGARVEKDARRASLLRHGVVDRADPSEERENAGRNRHEDGDGCREDDSAAH